MTNFIESGFDIINPVQMNAKGMENENLKNSYGYSLAFWGGGVDTQQPLPLGTPKEVGQQVIRECEIFAKDGGFVFNMVHNIQTTVLFDNVIAMLNAIKIFNGV